MTENLDQILAFARSKYLEIWQTKVNLLTGYTAMAKTFPPEKLASGALNQLEMVATQKIVSAVQILNQMKPNSALNQEPEKDELLAKDPAFVTAMTQLKEQFKAAAAIGRGEDARNLDRKLAEAIKAGAGEFTIAIKTKSEDGTPLSALAIGKQCIDLYGGLAVADAHYETAPKELASALAPYLKEKGIPAFDIETVSEINGLFLAGGFNRSQLIDKIQHDQTGLREAMVQGQVKGYGTTLEKAEKAVDSHLKMIVDYLEAGAVLGMLDKPQVIIDLENENLGLGHRISTSNYEWTNIAMTAQATAAGANGGKKPNHLEFAGAAHFIGSKEDGAMGLVDDSLHSPVICFTKGKAGDEAMVEGNIIYVPCGEQYPDVRANAFPPRPSSVSR